MIFSILFLACTLTGCGLKPTKSMDRDAVRKTVLKNKRAFHQCYKNSLSKNNSAEGKVVLQWTIIEGGFVRDAEAKVLDESMIGSGLEECLTEELSSLVFPAPPDDLQAKVVFPFVFSAPIR